MKIDLPHTYAYIDFISNEEQSKLIDWASSILENKELNGNGFGRYFKALSKLSYVDSIVYEIKNRIIEIEGITEAPLDPFFEDFLSFNLTGAAIHPHSDPNIENRIHTRYNLLVSLPDSGGQPIYNGNILELQEKTLWRCEAGKYVHASTPVKGKKPRINISYGFQI
jgi:hypothetical protein